jgi:hypothetical protein
MPRPNPAALTDVPGPGDPGPAAYSVRFYFRSKAGPIVEVDALLLMPDTDWADRPEYGDTAWNAARLGPYTLAARLTT